MAAFSNLEASARAATDQSDTGRTPQSVILQFANEEYPEIIRRIADFAPQPWTAYSADLTVAVGATSIDISTLTTLLQILEVQRKQDGQYFAIDPASRDPGNVCKLTWEQRGLPGAGCVVDLFPPLAAPATYRIKYVAYPGDLTVSPDATVKIPIGAGFRALVEGVAARIRIREEEDPNGHYTAQNNALTSMKIGLQPKGGAIAVTRRR